MKRPGALAIALVCAAAVHARADASSGSGSGTGTGTGTGSGSGSGSATGGDGSGETIEVHAPPAGPTGGSRIDAATARAQAGTEGDAAKIVQSLPGVARPGAGQADLVVWGAAPGETRVFVDGVPVAALFHAGGYRSAVGNDLLGDVRLTPAAFGVDRGGAIGAIVDVTMADPAVAPELRARADVLDGSLAGRVHLGAATVAAALRYSWLDRAVALVEDPAQLAPDVPLPRWADAQLVLRAPLAPRVTVTSWAIASTDLLDRTLVSSDPATQTDEHATRRDLRAQVTLRRDRAEPDDGHDLVTLWAGRDRSADDTAFGTTTAVADSRTWLLGARAQQEDRLADAAALELGLDADAAYATLSRLGSLTIPAREGDPTIFGQPPGADVNSDAWRATTIDAAAHAAVELHAGRISATLGARTDAWLLGASRTLPRVGSAPGFGGQQIVTDVDPRASVQLRVTPELAVRLDAGRYHQARDAADTSAVFGTPGLALEQAWHAVAGARYRLGPAALELVAFGRLLDDLVVRDPSVTPPLGAVLAQHGRGTVVGAQLTARVAGWRGISGWLAYDLSRSRRTDDPTLPSRFFDHDQTHGLVAVASWQRGPWSAGARVRYATGEPRTAVIGAIFDAQSGHYQPLPGPVDGTRLPAFFAVDLRGDRAIALPARLRGAVYLEVQNVTDRRNAEDFIYNADFSQRGALASLPLLAIAGVRVER